MGRPKNTIDDNIYISNIYLSITINVEGAFNSIAKNSVDYRVNVSNIYLSISINISELCTWFIYLNKLHFL